MTVDGHRALRKSIVQGRVEFTYHPLPRVGEKVSDVRCPAGLEAGQGATPTCTGEQDDGGAVDIPVTVVEATDSSVTRTFQR
ncbi:DUF4333 domain-containing protein [Streptomyces sp. ID05-04B]|uniref:DUF4333 domain-containing protein n=1 Tax=unclassified Streptomyces TaxID=2593676 RepID=UPI00265A6E02|nr:MULTISPECIES: DUF4333 domain-containing protein [unclassified Streptomyces]MDX5568879.1 DUF4333 domain-containing protein [Streptomyces sp. ID05-04B]